MRRDWDFHKPKVYFEPKKPEGHQISSFAYFSGAIPDSAIPAQENIFKQMHINIAGHDIITQY
jgi:hypothetical protein